MIERFVTDAAPAPKGPYSHGVIAEGRTLYCAAQVGVDPATGDLAEGVAAQAAQALANLEAICSAAGGRLADALRLTLYLEDFADVQAANAAFVDVFGEERPARTTIIAADLVGGASVCIDAIVALPS